MKHRWYNAVMGKKKASEQKISPGKRIALIGGIIVSIITIIGAFIGVGIYLGEIRKSIDNLDSRVSDVSTSLDTRINDFMGTYNTRIDRIEDDLRSLTADYSELYRSLGIAEDRIAALPLQSTGQITESIMQMSYQRNDDIYYGQLDLGDGIVAVGIDSTEYTAEDLQNQPIIVAYEENGQQVFFMGQFDENNQWTGECLINVYQDGNFVIATEALYDSGQRRDYEQLFPDNGKWIYSKRIDQETYNGGDTWTYELTVPVKQKISYEKPEATDMIRPSDIESSLGTPLLSHYHGNTSDGKYNDDTGSAYLVDYYEDGSTRLLYQGRFTDGLQNDSTGEAWQIARDKAADTDYMLYKGIFKNGRQMQSQSEAADWDNPLHKDKLEEYTAGQPFEGELNWDMNYIAQ